MIIKKEEEKIKLTPFDYIVYALVVKRSSVRPSDIAEKLDKQTSNVSRSLRKLRLKKMVTEFKDSDRRKTWFVANEIKGENSGTD